MEQDCFKQEDSPQIDEDKQTKIVKYIIPDLVLNGGNSKRSENIKNIYCNKSEK